VAWDVLIMYNGTVKMDDDEPRGTVDRGEQTENEADTPVDHAERERIRISLDESLIVEAAAGTGKTTELITRLVNVLAEGRGRVDTVVAVTFTERAAGELKLRLRARLEDERGRAAEGTPRRLNLEGSIARLEEARISTIHGFCKDLLQERPVEARVDPRFAVLDETEAEALYGQAFDRWLEPVLDDPPEGVRRALRRGTRRRSDEGADARLRGAGWMLAGWRDLPAPWRRPDFDREARIEDLVGRVHALAGHLRACVNKSDALYRKLWRLRRFSDDLAIGERVQGRDHDAVEGALVELAEDRDFRQPGRGAARAFGGREALDEILAAHADLAAAVEEFATLANADLAALLHAELRGSIERYEALKQAAGRVDFFDLLLRARDLVRDNPDVRAELQGRFSHVFVDEFQDTDPLQAEILLLLASADPTAGDWREVTPSPGKLFLVGDPKQSIYRFRRADVGVYQLVKERLGARGVACLYLRTSFRSVPELQALVNGAFEPVMREDPAALQAGYVPLAPHRDSLAGQPSVVALPVPRPYGGAGLTKTAMNAALPDAVAAFVGWLIGESGWCVTERDLPGRPVPLAPRHVCLLFRRFSSFDEDVTRPFVEALEARGIAHLLVGGKSFHTREEVESLRTALTAVEWPDDELSVYGTLKGPLFAIGDEELMEYRQARRRLHPYRLPTSADDPLPERLRPIVEALSLLRELHRRRNARPAEETVRDLLQATRAHAGFVLRPWGEQALANVMRVVELARRYEVSGGISFRGFVEQLRLDAGGEAPEAPIVEEASEGVRLMTVHRAKGLEFPVVILADVTANLTPQRPSRHVDPARGLCALGLSRWLPLDLLEHETEEMARERAEGLRVAYVAATRARDLLVVPAVGDDPFAVDPDFAESGWVVPLQRALYPSGARRRLSTPAPGCPTFGEDSVLRPEGEPPGPDNVRPGLHGLVAGAGAYPVVWWDPSQLTLEVEPLVGLRRDDLLKEVSGIVEADLARYETWRAERQATLERGAWPSVVVRPVTEWARAPEVVPPDLPAIEVEVIDVGVGGDHPGGPRFGTLVHAVLAAVPLDATPAAIAEGAELHARILGASAAETAAACDVAGAVLAHPLMARAREAFARGRCRRETPVAGAGPDGALLEGVLDLAFEDDQGWTIVDFKTTAQMAGVVERYRRQVALYAWLVRRATGRAVRAVLLRA
jgi:ATP-dependent exoDNAse (exonuclease V) beta subunit